jgi:hypothetical protein
MSMLTALGLTFLTSFAVPVRAQSAVPPELDEAFARDAHRRLRFVRQVAELDVIPAQGFAETAGKLLAERGDELRCALVHVAGRGVPGGLSTARDAERRAHREAARALLAADLPATRALLEQLLARPEAELAADGEPRAPGTEPPCSHPALRASATTLVGAFGLYDLAPAVACLLDLGAEPTTVVAARGALHMLHGRWYSGRAAFQALWPRLVGKGANELFLDELAERERTSEARLLALLEAQPAAHVAQALAEPSPALRARVAESVARSVAARTLPLDEAWARLRAQLALEPSATASGALLAALIELLQGAPGNDTRTSDLRVALGELVARGAPELDDLALRALQRLPVQDTADIAAADLVFASQVLVRMVDGSRPLDPDLVVQCLSAYASVARRVADAAQRRGASGAAPEHLRALVEGRLGVSARTRVAAADALAAVLTAADVEILLEILRVSEEPTVRYRLVGVLADAAPLVTEPSALRRIAEALLVSAESPEAGVRARAVELLVDVRVGPALAAAREHDPGFDLRVLELLRAPGTDAERIAVLEVLGNSPRTRGPAPSPAQVRLLTELLRGDTLRPLATGAPQVLDALVLATQRIAHGNAAQLWSAADLLTLELPGTQEVDRPSRPRRVAAALRLVLALDGTAAAALTPERHAAIIAWFLELRAPGGEPGEALHLLDAAGRARLSEVHAAAALDQVGGHDDPTAEAPVQAQRARAATIACALLAVDGLTEASSQLERTTALQCIDAALDAALTDARSSDAARLQLERARLTDSLARPADAEHDFALALAAAPDLLASRDLRRLAVLAKELGRSERAVTALMQLVGRAVWRTRPAEVRLADLEALADAALRTRDEPQVAAVRALLAGVPPLPAGDGVVTEAPEPAAGVRPLWAGLPGAGRAEHGRLLAIVARLDGALPSAAPSSNGG